MTAASQAATAQKPSPSQAKTPPQRRFKLSVSLHLVWDAAVLRIAVTSGTARARRDGSIIPLRCALAGHVIAAQGLGLCDLRAAHQRQSPVRIRDRTPPQGSGRGLSNR